MEIAATGGAAARRMGSRASRPVESVKAIHAEIVVMMLLSLKKTYTMTLEASDIVLCKISIIVNSDSEYCISVCHKSYFECKCTSECVLFQYWCVCGEI